MAFGFLYGNGGGGGENKPNSIIISGNQLNYEYMDNGVVGFGTDCVTLTYQSGQSNRMYIYNVDLTNIISISITVKCGTSDGDFRIEKIGSTTVAQVLKTGSSIQTVSFDVSNYIGLQTLEFSNNYYGTSSIYNMVLVGYPKAEFPVIYDHGSWSVSFENPGQYTWQSGVSTEACTLLTDRIRIQKGSDASHVPVIGTTGTIDLTSYSQLRIRAKGIDTQLAGTYGHIGVFPSKSNIGTQSAPSVTVSSTSEVEYIIDVSNLSGDYYIAVYGRVFWSFEVYRIWLE